MSASRLFRVLLSFAAVVAAYWTYALLAVPWIEPPARQRADTDSQNESRQNPQQTRGRYDRQLAEIFGPEDWERQKPNVIETQQAMLLFKDYKTLEDGRMQLAPCTFIFYPEAKQRSSRDRGRAVVMRAPEGAILEFDRPLKVQRAQFGQLVGGRLVGDVTISSNESQPGAGDHLLLTTRNIQMDPKRIWTPHEVKFRYGANYGSGRDLIITLLEKADSNSKHGPNIGGLKSIELVHVDQLHLVSRSDAGQDAARDNQEFALEVTCTGPFLLDLMNHVATFEEEVDVLRLVPDGPSDQLNCLLLEIHFTPVETTGKQQLSKLDIQRIVALGHPVVVRSPSMDAGARGERLQYNLNTRRIRLDGRQAVMLYHQGRRIDAPNLEYELSPDGRLGEVWADGPGTFRGLLDDERIMQANWQNSLRLRPDGHHHLLSLTGGTRVGLDPMGGLSAEEIHLWLLETASHETAANASSSGSLSPGYTPADGSNPLGQAQGKRKIQPDRLLAKGDVKLRSTQLDGATDRLEVWFRPAKTYADEAAPPAENNSPRFSRQLGQRPGRSPTKFDISARLLRVLLLHSDSGTELADATASGDVQLKEIQARPTDEAPLLLHGNTLRISQAHTTKTVIKTTGQPAHLEARGMALEGGNVQLDRAVNRAWIDGPGTMTIAMQQAPDGQQLSKPVPLTISWSKDMDFDGRTIHFRRDVVARTQYQRAAGPSLDISLSRRINFADPGGREGVDVRTVRFNGLVSMQNKTVEQDELTTIEDAQVRNLNIDLHTGAVAGDGPGWMRSVRRGGNGLNVASAGPLAPRGAENKAATGDDRLTFLHVTFERAISGNVHQRELHFHEDVRTTYGPVEDFNDRIDPRQIDDPESEVVLLRCDKLSAAEIGQRTDGRAPLELTALGNTLVEGQTYTARAHRISYAQAKELLVLEGTLRSPAELYRQMQVGGDTAQTAAQKIYYWTKTGRMDVDGVPYLDFTGPLGTSGQRELPSGVRRILQDSQRRAPAPSTPPQ